MNAKTVTSINDGSKDSYEQVLTWLKQMAERGIYPQNTARNRITALEAVVSTLGGDEPRDPEWLLSNVKALVQRWATANGVAGETPRTYCSKARSALADYIQWKNDPTAFRPKSRAVKRDKTKATDESAKAAASAPNISTSSTEGARSYPLGPERGSFDFSLPPEGVNVRDVTKIALHLLTYATDFDPTHSGRDVLAVVREETST